MSIKSVASTDEITSHTYKVNKELCSNWEHYILGKKGEVNGEYSEATYKLEGRVKENTTWSIEVEKEAAPKGRQRIGEKKKNAKESINLSTLIEDTDCEKFYIKNGVAKRGQSNNDFYRSILNLLMDEFNTSDIYEVYFEDDMLTFVIHFKNNRFNLVDAILDFTYPEIED
jgi:hypothetical protein